MSWNMVETNLQNKIHSSLCNMFFFPLEGWTLIWIKESKVFSWPALHHIARVSINHPPKQPNRSSNPHPHGTGKDIGPLAEHCMLPHHKIVLGHPVDIALSEIILAGCFGAENIHRKPKTQSSSLENCTVVLIIVTVVSGFDDVANHWALAASSSLLLHRPTDNSWTLVYHFFLLRCYF